MGPQAKIGGPSEQRGARNAYDCQNEKCRAVRVYEHVDSGVTPFYVRCDCGSMMVSRMYRAVPRELPTTHEWYRPWTAAEARALSDVMLEHVLKGGALQRKREPVG